MMALRVIHHLQSLRADTDFYEYTMTGITASTTIKFTTEGATSDKRAIIFGINIK